MESYFDDEAVANFCAVTGADDEMAKYYLGAADGDLDSAISLFFGWKRVNDGK